VRGIRRAKKNLTEKERAMTAVAVEQSCAAMAHWSNRSNKIGAVSFTACSPVEGPSTENFTFKLENVRIPFEPSCFQGNGTETRLTLCFSGVDEKLRQQLAAIEKDIGATTSCLKNDDLLRCKINMDKVDCCDADCMRIELPKILRGCTVNACLWLRGKWKTEQGCGLSLEVTQLQILHAREPWRRP
jgi:hypothetical protein